MTVFQVLSLLEGTSAVQTFIYQFVVLNKINRLTLKRFEQKYLLLSGFTFEVAQISPANTLYSIQCSALFNIFIC